MADTATIPANTATAVDVLANDSGSGIALSGTPSSSEPGVSITYRGDELSVDARGYEWAADETELTVDVSYEIRDSFGKLSGTVATVTVVRAPVVSDDADEVPSGGTVTFAPDILNPSTVAADGCVVSSQPAAGTVILDPKGHAVFDAAGVDAGTYTFELTVTDSFGQQTTATYTVTVYAGLAGVDDAFTVASTFETVIDPLANDDGEGLTLTSLAGNAILDRGIVTYVPDPNRSWGDGEQSYEDLVTYVVTDGRGLTATQTITLTVIRAPQGLDRHLTVTPDVERIAFDPIGEAKGTNIQMLEDSSLHAEPAHGTVTFENGFATYVPTPGFAGEDSFTVELRDALGQTAIVTYSVTVEAKLPITPPTASEQPGPGHEHTTEPSADSSAPTAPETQKGLAVTGSEEPILGWSLLFVCVGGLLLIARRVVRLPEKGKRPTE
nr:Ig-like domain-containing protein [Lysinibacter cavernae]